MRAVIGTACLVLSFIGILVLAGLRISHTDATFLEVVYLYGIETWLTSIFLGLGIWCLIKEFEHDDY
jgi:hypothetical protein